MTKTHLFMVFKIVLSKLEIGVRVNLVEVMCQKPPPKLILNEEILVIPFKKETRQESPLLTSIVSHHNRDIGLEEKRLICHYV